MRQSHKKVQFYQVNDLMHYLNDSRMTQHARNSLGFARVSVQGVKSLGDHFARLCWGFEFYEVKKKKLLFFFKKKMEMLSHFLSFL